MSDQQIEIPAGQTARGLLETLSYEHGPRIAPDSAPTVGNVFVNGVATTLSTAPTIAQLQDETPANITGSYEVSFPTGAPNNLAAGDTVWVEVLATISGNSAPRKTFNFLVVPASASSTPMIR